MAVQLDTAIFNPYKLYAFARAISPVQNQAVAMQQSGRSVSPEWGVVVEKTAAACRKRTENRPKYSRHTHTPHPHSARTHTHTKHAPSQRGKHAYRGGSDRMCANAVRNQKRACKVVNVRLVTVCGCMCVCVCGVCVCACAACRYML
jgi:hypothetical protein